MTRTRGQLRVTVPPGVRGTCSPAGMWATEPLEPADPHRTLNPNRAGLS